MLTIRTIPLARGTGRTMGFVSGVLSIVCGVGVAGLILFIEAVAGTGVGAVTWVLAALAVVVPCTTAILNWITWGHQPRLEINDTFLRIVYPGFREPMILDRRAVRTVAVDPRSAALDRFPVRAEPGQELRWLFPQNRRLIPFLRVNVEDLRPNVALLFNRPLDTPPASFAGWTSRVLGSSRRGVRGLMLKVPDAEQAERALSSWSPVRLLDPKDVDDDLTRRSVEPWALALLAAVLTAMMAMAAFFTFTSFR